MADPKDEICYTELCYNISMGECKKDVTPVH